MTSFNGQPFDPTRTDTVFAGEHADITTQASSGDEPESSLVLDSGAEHVTQPFATQATLHTTFKSLVQRRVTVTLRTPFVDDVVADIHIKVALRHPLFRIVSINGQRYRHSVRYTAWQHHLTITVVTATSPPVPPHLYTVIWGDTAETVRPARHKLVFRHHYDSADGRDILANVELTATTGGSFFIDLPVRNTAARRRAAPLRAPAH